MVVVALLPLFASGLTVGEVASPPTGRDVYASQTSWSDGGNDPLQFLEGERPNIPPVGAVPGYPERDRDLGQIFTAPATREPFRLESIALRLDTAKTGADGAEVSLEFFEVGGWPAAHDNKTRHEKVVAWTDDPRADDYLTGETYQTVKIFSGRLPASLHPEEWLRFALRGAPILRPGKRYAFLLMFDHPAPERSLTLSSRYWGDYAGGHAIRREGSVVEGWNDPAWACRDILPTDRKTRLAQPPSVWGRPNVDTWRDLAFTVQGKPWYGG
ncbi:hypothetical protein BH11ARM2_BH11ARM2_25310 [soil metagenome]